MSTYPYQIHLDRKTCLKGVYAAPNTTWTLPFTDASINCIIASNDFGANGGKIIIPSSNNGTAVVAAGDWSGGCTILGRLFSMSVELSRFYRRNGIGEADIDAWLSIQNIVMAYHESGPFSIRASMTGRQDRTVTFAQADGVAGATDELKAWFNGDTRDLRVFIESVGPKTVNVSSIQAVAEYVSRRN